MIPIDELRKSIELINNEIDELKIQLENITGDLSQYHDDIIGVIDYLRDFSKLYNDLKKDEKIEYIKTIVDKLYLFNKEVKFEFKKPFKDLLKAIKLERVTPLGVTRNGWLTVFQ